MIDHLRNQQAYIINTSKDKFGDQNETSRTSEMVRFRYVTDIEQNTNREGIVSTEAVIHLRAEANVSEGTIIFMEDDNSYWRVETLVKARKMDATVHFLKALVQRHKM